MTSRIVISKFPSVKNHCVKEWLRNYSDNWFRVCFLNPGFTLFNFIKNNKIKFLWPSIFLLQVALPLRWVKV